MHPEARQWCKINGNDNHGLALDIGGQEINGNCREYWPNMKWTIIDIVVDPGPIGDTEYIICDASEWRPDKEYDLVLSTEVFEHTDKWPQIIKTAYKALKSDGALITTCAGPGRDPHNANGRLMEPGEYYKNVGPEDLKEELYIVGFDEIHVEENKASKDVYSISIKDCSYI